MNGDERLQSRLLDELCGVVLSLLRSPQLFHGGSEFCFLTQRSRISPAGLVSLILGASVALMLCGSVTFFLGCIMMPWIISVVVFFYFVGVVSCLSRIWKAILCPTVSTRPSKKVPGTIW